MYALYTVIRELWLVRRACIAYNVAPLLTNCILRLVVLANEVDSILVRNMLMGLIIQPSLNSTPLCIDIYAVWTLDHVIVAIALQDGFVILW